MNRRRQSKCALHRKGAIQRVNVEKARGSRLVSRSRAFWKSLSRPGGGRPVFTVKATSTEDPGRLRTVGELRSQRLENKDSARVGGSQVDEEPHGKLDLAGSPGAALAQHPPKHAGDFLLDDLRQDPRDARA